MAQKILSVNNLSVTFGNKNVLNKISFDLHQGDYVGLIGPNGAGKSTLLKSILGIVKFKGEIKLMPKINIGYVPQQLFSGNFFSLSVKEILSMSLKRKSIFLTKAEKELLLEKLISVGLNKIFLNANFNNLSEGQKQRVIIARSLVGNPQLLIFDEPLNFIDFKTKILLYNLLAQLNKKLQITILFVSHDMDQIIAKCQRILCLNQKLHKGCHLAELTRDPSETESCDYETKVKTNVMGIHHHHLQ